MSKAPDIRHIFDQILKDFESDPNPKEDLIPARGVKGAYTVREYRIPQDPKYWIGDPYLIFIIFVHLKQFKFKGRDEKEAWTVKGRSIFVDCAVGLPTDDKDGRFSISSSTIDTSAEAMEGAQVSKVGGASKDYTWYHHIRYF